MDKHPRDNCLSGLLSPTPTNHHRWGNIEAAQDWIKYDLGIRVDPSKDDCLIIAGLPVYLDSLSDIEFNELRKCVDEFGARLFDPFLKPRQKSYLSALEDCDKACEHVLKFYRVVAFAQGDRKLMKFGYKGEKDLTPLNSLYISKEEHLRCVQKLLFKHNELWEMLWKAALERKALAPTYQYYHDFRQIGCSWEGKRYATAPFERLGTLQDLVVLDLSIEPFRRALRCCSGKECGKTPALPRRILGVLCNGSLAYASPETILVPIRQREIKNVFLHLGYSADSSQNSSVWGFALSLHNHNIVLTTVTRKVAYRCHRDEVYLR